jgi:hypothetical protein
MNAIQLDKFIKKHKKYCVEFLNDPTEFVNKVITFATQGKNHVDLAEHLKLPESLVKSLVFIIKNYQLEKQCKSFEAFLLNLTDKEKFYKSFIYDNGRIAPAQGPNGLTISLWIKPLKDNNWFYGDDPINIYYPIKPEPNYNLSLEVFFGNEFNDETWELNLRNITGNKNSIVSAQNIQEKKEILKMLELMIKYNL